MAFWRLQEALEHYERRPEKEDLHVFSFQVSLTGGRKFQVSKLNDFWNSYQNTELKYYYEVIRDDVKTKLYYDLEFFANFNPHKCGHEMVKRLIQININKLKEIGHETDDSQVLVLEAFYKQKFSCHLIFVNTVFSNNLQVKAFVENLISTLTPEDKDIFTVSDEKDRQQLFIDRSVYKLNQQMRIFQSRKLGRSNPLIISSISKYKHKDFSKETLFASLITKIESQTAVIETEFKSNATSRRRDTNSSRESPFSEIDRIIAEIVSPGRISGWTYHASSNTYCYSIVNYSYCKNVEREHSHAKVYFLYCVTNNTLWQQCFAEKCRGFRSLPIETPDLSWLNDMESWSE